jgi:uncharacterized damage-inducible protein DinB
MKPYGAPELANAFRTVRKNTIQIAEDIPEDKYDFVAAPGVQSIGGLLRHITFAPMMQDDMHRVKRITTFKGHDFGAATKAAADMGKKLESKADILGALRNEGERFATWLESLDDAFFSETVTDPMGQNPKSRFELLLGVKEHEMHHRGQLMLMQRMIGLVPHLTRQREERIRQRQAAAAGARG